MRTILGRTRSSGAVMGAHLTASMLLGDLLTVIFLCGGGMPAVPANVAQCTNLGGVWDEATATCTVDRIWLDGLGLHVPVMTTLAVTGDFAHAATIVGPGPGVLAIEDVTIDGHLIVSGTATNEGPVYVNGRLTVSGRWYDTDRYRYVCDEMRGICVESSTAGHITNHGDLTISDYAWLSTGLTNRGDWVNTGHVDAGGEVRNRGNMTHTGTLTITGRLLNQDSADVSGGLTNQGEIWNWGMLTGSIVNHGLLYSSGVLSATVTGDGPVYVLEYDSYLPRMHSGN